MRVLVARSFAIRRFVPTHNLLLPESLSHHSTKIVTGVSRQNRKDPTYRIGTSFSCGPSRSATPQTQAPLNKIILCAYAHLSSDNQVV
jgi:hypothetical protein